MDYYGIGYSNIRLANSSNSYAYRYNTNANTFPEEILLHEFLHSLERDSIEYGYNIPALHDYEKYEYKNKSLVGLKDWYQAYMNKTIKTTNGNIGLPEQVYTLKPVKESDFEYSYKKENFKEPSNTIEEIRQVFKNVIHNIKNLKSKNDTINNTTINASV